MELQTTPSAARDICTHILALYDLCLSKTKGASLDLACLYQASFLNRVPSLGKDIVHLRNILCIVESTNMISSHIHYITLSSDELVAIDSLLRFLHRLSTDPTNNDKI